jgi:hypothetical protein
MEDRPISLAVDVVLQALIGPEGCPVERLVAEAARRERKLVITERALFYAFCSLRKDDEIHLQRFCELVRHASVEPSLGRPETGLELPTAEETANWRMHALEPSQQLSIIPLPGLR